MAKLCPARVRVWNDEDAMCTRVRVWVQIQRTLGSRSHSTMVRTFRECVCMRVCVLRGKATAWECRQWNVVCEVIKKELTFKSVCARYSQVTSNLEYNQHFMMACSTDFRRNQSFCPFPHLRRFGMINDNTPASPTFLSGCYSVVSLYLFLVRWKVR